jgi:hypothetical protein
MLRWFLERIALEIASARFIRKLFLGIVSVDIQGTSLRVVRIDSNLQLELA